MTKPHPTYLDPPSIHPTQITASADLRYLLIDTLQTLLQQTNHTLITPPKPTLDPETFLNSLKTHPNVYQASLSRQFAADFPPDIEQTTLKDEPKDWYIKTADFGDECDRPLQHRDGEYTQLLEDIEEYHQILQQGCDRIIILRPPNYGAYDTLINAAMQCLGYSLDQFRYIIIQPLKLYAFHQPSKQLHTIPDLPPDELMQAIGPDALRWHCFSTPLTEIAPINISTAGQSTAADSLHRIQITHAHCCTLLQRATQQGIINTQNPFAPNFVSPSSNLTSTLANQLQSTPQILEKSAKELAPHLLCHHLLNISETCEIWFQSLTLDIEACILLVKIKQVFLEILQNILKIKAAELTSVA
jgi:arginyl-tRNA synthetase